MRKCTQIFLLLVSICCSLPMLSTAQEKTSGRVIDAATNQPVAGASVLVSGTRRGTTTGNDGVFTIVVRAGEELIVSSLGYQDLRVKANALQQDIKLTPAGGNLQDVVVVGYGSQKRAALTGSVSYSER